MVCNGRALAPPARKNVNEFTILRGKQSMDYFSMAPNLSSQTYSILLSETETQKGCHVQHNEDILYENGCGDIYMDIQGDTSP